MPFTTLKTAVAAQFERMRPFQLFRVALDKNVLWDAYLATFPAELNPMYRERTEHDCQCCKQFIRSVGGVVALVEGVVLSLWDCKAAEYQPVVDALAALVHGSVIEGPFLHYEETVGTAKNFEAVLSTQTGVLSKSGQENVVKSWEHFHLRLPSSAVAAKADIGPRLSDAGATHDVMLRSLSELSTEAIDTVLELIAQNSLYRGEEQKWAVSGFRELKVQYDRLSDHLATASLHDVEAFPQKKEVFVWENSFKVNQSISRIRNTAIGTLMVDLSEDVPMEDAVKSFEAKVAPANYKRPTALVTKAMIAKAKATIEELGLTTALERRYATLDDVSAANVLFVDRSVRSATMNPALGAPYGKGLPFTGDDVFSALATSIPERLKTLDRVEEVPIAKFLADVLPKAKVLEVLLENKFAGNLVSLVAPVDPGAKHLFKWPNGFSWSYAGDVADSMKERVKKAGGSVTGDLLCRLAWDYTDDLDFHMTEPNRFGVFYGNRRTKSGNGGELDVDANGCDGMKADPVENIFYGDRRRMQDGVYTLWVHNYNRRSAGTGFEAEVEFDGVLHSMAYKKTLKNGERVEVAQIKVSKGVFKLLSSLPSEQASKTLWGLQSQTFQKVSLLTVSPNYWFTETLGTNIQERGGFGIGNKHWFFMLENCVNADGARGFYNEFLKAELEPHRKVLEMVGAKMRTDESARQLSGLGFSSTQRNALTVRVTGASTRVLKVVF